METLDHLTVTIVAEDTVGYETPYLGQHGISFYLVARHGEVERRFLVDVAQHPGPLLHNMELLGIDPAGIDAIVLTHCHYDHTQGLVEILRAIGKRDLPVVAHPDLFRLNFVTEPFLRHIGVMNSDGPEQIRAAGGTIYPVSEPLQLLPGLTTTGEIARSTEYEGNEMLLKTVRDGKVVSDDMRDDVSLCANVAGAGPVVITGCSHAGVVNITRQAKKLVGTTHVAAVIGGFHMIESDGPYITRSVKDLQAETVHAVLAGHCTGFPAQVELNSVFGSAFQPLRTGQTFRFPA